MLSTKDLKVKLLGITPVWADETGMLTPEQLVAFSGLLTYSGKPINEIVSDAKKNGLDINKKIAGILRASSLKGHASMATTPALSFSYEASKFIDSGLTGIVFASAIMASGRRTDTTADDIVYPLAIQNQPVAEKIYTSISRKNIDFFNKMLDSGINKDEASKILQYGIYGTGIIQLTIESLAALRREYEAEVDWLPEDIGFLIKCLEKELKQIGAAQLYATRLAAPRTTYPYPNIFKNPALTNFARENSKKCQTGEYFKIISYDLTDSPGLKNRLENLRKKIETAAADKNLIKQNWEELLKERQQICRDYDSSVNIKIFSSTAWRVWGDKKRHRTVPMVVDSVYYAAQTAIKIFEDFAAGIKNKNLNKTEIDKIDTIFSVPPNIRASSFLYEYLEHAANSLLAYSNLTAGGIKPKDAIFAVPRGIKLNIVQHYNLYNLIAGYYPLRLCTTAEEELRRLSISEVNAIKNLLCQQNMDYLAWHIAPKCYDVGFCLEQNCCGKIGNLTANYDADFHKAIHKDLEQKFQAIMENLN